MASLKKILKKFLGRDKKISGHYWEYYNRINILSNEIKALNIPNCSVLDVGGIKSNNLLKKFGLDNITTLNISGDSDVTASADAIPFEDSSFDVVSCIDTLEHIPRQMRGPVVSELFRTAKRAVFIAAPVDTEENRLAESMVMRYLPTSGYIKDHLVHGLVDFGDLKKVVTACGKSSGIENIKEIDLDNLMFWVLAMIGDKEDVSKLYQEIYYFENRHCPRRKALLVYKSVHDKPNI